MSDTKPSFLELKQITDEQIDRIAGGSCSAEEITKLIDDLKQNYDTLVDFTSYVIERVVTGTTTGN